MPQTARIGLMPARSARVKTAALVCLRNRYAYHARVGERAAHEGHIFHAGEVKVRDELAATTHQAIIFLAEKACADALRFHRGLRRHGKPDLWLAGFAGDGSHIIASCRYFHRGRSEHRQSRMIVPKRALPGC